MITILSIELYYAILTIYCLTSTSDTYNTVDSALGLLSFDSVVRKMSCHSQMLVVDDLIMSTGK